MSPELTWKHARGERSKETERERDCDSECEKDRESCFKRRVEAFMHACLLVSAVRLLVSFVVFAVLCPSCPVELCIYVCKRGSGVVFTG